MDFGNRNENQGYSQIQSEMKKAEVSWVDRNGELIGIGLFIFSICDIMVKNSIVNVIFSVFIIIGASFCIKKKYRLKGFSIAAIVFASICLLSGLGNIGGLDDSKDKEVVKEIQNDNSEKEIITKQPVSTPVPEPTKSESKQEKSKNEEIKKSEINSKKQLEGNEGDNTKDGIVVEEQEKGVDTELKAFLDSYEEFVDEYVVFMKNYSSDPMNALNMLSQYTEIMEKYVDFADKIDQYNSKEMSKEDEKYYIEVTTRCTQKMIDLL